jgi:AraC-like DNA-binding protein
MLSLLKLRTYVYGGFDAGGDWAMEFGAHNGVKFYAVTSGECWLSVDGLDEPSHVIAGDCLLLPTGRPFRVASDLTIATSELSDLNPIPDSDVVSLNGGGDFFSVGGYFTLSGDHSSMLLSLLPSIIHIREENDRTILRWYLDRLRHELRVPQPGGTLAAQQLGSLMLIQALRQHLAQNPAGGIGWLYALADKPISKAIQAIHVDPAQRWTLQSLGAHVGMSRTVFALRFKEKVGVSVMDYLTRWRMLLAEGRLEAGNDSLADISQSLGYESESSFCTAFKRTIGVSPRQYARKVRSFQQK